MSDGGEGGGGWIELEKTPVERTPETVIPHIPHYYGGISRQLLLVAAAAMLVGAPLYGGNLRIQFPFIVVGVLVLVAFAALTSPRYMWVSLGSSVASGVGVLAYSVWAMLDYTSAEPVTFVIRVAIAIVFLSAFYYSLKTVRAFTLHQIGRVDAVDDFELEAEKKRAESLERAPIHKDLLP